MSSGWAVPFPGGHRDWRYSGSTKLIGVGT
jgi:hypothetical protein